MRGGHVNQRDLLKLQNELRDKIKNHEGDNDMVYKKKEKKDLTTFEKPVRPVWEKDEVTRDEMLGAIDDYDKKHGKKSIFPKESYKARYVQPTLTQMVITIQEPGRPVVAVDSAVISMYIKDNLEQPFHYLVARMADELNYNYLDLMNYLMDRVLYYNTPEGDHYIPVLWECDKTVPGWVDDIMDCVYNWQGFHSTKRHEVRKTPDFMDKLKNRLTKKYPDELVYKD